MRQWFLAVILIAGISWLAAPIAWWIFLVPSLLVPLCFQNGLGRTFWLGFVAIGVLYGITIFDANLDNDGILLERISGMFTAPGWTIALTSVLVPALLSGICTWSSSALGNAIRRENVK